jgi:hypothetical protein
VVEERQKNPSFELPEQFLKLIVRLKPVLDELWPHIEQRYRAIQASRQSTTPLVSLKPDAISF